MANSMNILRASTITLEVIKEGSISPEEILEILISGDDNKPEKLEALVERSDVTGFRAYKLLCRVSSNSLFFTAFFKLYIKKFIQNKPREESLYYTVMTLQLWIHFIGSSDEYKSKDVAVMLPRLKPMLILFIQRWPIYKKSAVKFFDDLELMFGNQYDHRSKLPGDDLSPFRYSVDNHVPRELRMYIFPFIGQTLIELAQTGKYYKNTKDLRYLATGKYFGDGDKIGWLYIKSIEKTFTLSDIKPFLWSDLFKIFLNSKDGINTKARFINLCENSPANEVFSLIGTQYEGFQFKDNLSYKKLSLSEKADFLKPYSSMWETNHRKHQLELLKIWIDDPGWNDPSTPISELMLIALKNRHIFSFNSRWYFREVMIVILTRINNESDSYFGSGNCSFFEKVSRGKFYSGNGYPEDFKRIGFVLKLIEVIKDRYSTMTEKEKEVDYWTSYTYKDALDQVELLFIENLSNYLLEYSTSDAYEAILLAEAFQNNKAMGIIIQRELTFDQYFCLLEKIKAKNPGDENIIRVLTSELLNFVDKIASVKECLQTAIYVLAKHEIYFTSHEILAPALGRKEFSNLSILLNTLQEIIIEDKRKIIVSESLTTWLPDKFKEKIRLEIEEMMDNFYKTKDEAMIFCQHPFFASNPKNWLWYYKHFPLESITDLDLIPLKKVEIQTIFSEGVPRENMLALWKSTSFKNVSKKFLNDFILLKNYLHEHPEWVKLSLEERLALFDPENKYGDYHFKMLPSLAINFEQLWKEENWTIKKYLDEIKRIDPLNPNKFAELAINLVS